MDVHKVDKKVKTLFDALGYRKTEGEDDMRQELKQVCLDFADKYPELGKLSFMKRRGKERYFITILLMIEDIDAAIISRVISFLTDCKSASYCLIRSIKVIDTKP